MTRRIKYILTSVICGVVLVTAAALVNRQNKQESTPTTIPTVPTNLDGTNYDPPTKEEATETNNFKKDLETKTNPESQPTTPSSANGSASVVITSLTSNQSVTANGYISNKFEDYGVCLLTLTLGNSTVTGTSTGIADVSKTTCPPISISRQKIPSAGTWTAVLSYKSSKSSGQSASQTIQVK